jgi:CheY-like chemotaxis protein
VLNNTDRKRLLLLEDEPVIGKIIKRVLFSYGFDVDIAENGLIGKEKIDATSAENCYDVLIFDIRTPIISGMQLYEYIDKAYHELTDRVIFATGDYMNTATRSFLERVDRPFLAKPYTPAQVRDMVYQVLGDNVESVAKCSTAVC